MTNQRQLGNPARNPLDVLTRPARGPDLVLRYGDGAEHVADVHLPRSVAPAPWIDGAAAERAGTGGMAPGTGGPAPLTGGPVPGTGGLAPLTIFLHGGFWRAEYGREHTAPLAEALADAGFAVCAPEYRRTGQPDGGWPGTFDDVAAAVDRLPRLVAQAAGGVIDLDRVVLAGHSAGGHLALWAASRHLLPAESPWRAQEPAGRSVVALAAVSDLAASYRWRLGQRATEALMGGGAEYYPDRYDAVDPSRLVPAGVPVRLVHGTGDDRVPWHMSLDYAVRARTSGATGVLAPTCVLLPGTGHFELIDPLSAEWPQVVAAFRAVAGFGESDRVVE